MSSESLYKISQIAVRIESFNAGVFCVGEYNSQNFIAQLFKNSLYCHKDE